MRCERFPVDGEWSLLHVTASFGDPHVCLVALGHDFRGRYSAGFCGATGDNRETPFPELIQQAKIFRQRSSRQLLTELAFAPQDFRHHECHDSPRRIEIAFHDGSPSFGEPKYSVASCEEWRIRSTETSPFAYR